MRYHKFTRQNPDILKVYAFQKMTYQGKQIETGKHLIGSPRCFSSLMRTIRRKDKLIDLGMTGEVILLITDGLKNKEILTII